MKSCMTGMHGLHNLFNNIRWNVGPCVVWRCIGTWRNMLPIYLRTVGYAAFRRGRAGDITRLVVHEALGTLWARIFAGSAFEQLEGRGKRCQPVVKPAATSQFFAPNHEQNNLMGINVYIVLLFGPAPFAPCLRAYKFHIPWLHYPELYAWNQLQTTCNHTISIHLWPDSFCLSLVTVHFVILQTVEREHAGLDYQCGFVKQWWLCWVWKSSLYTSALAELQKM